MKVFYWIQEGGYGIYCPQCQRGLGSAPDQTTASHLAHAHIHQTHDGTEWEWQEVANVEEAVAKAPKNPSVQDVKKEATPDAG